MGLEVRDVRDYLAPAAAVDCLSRGGASGA